MEHSRYFALPSVSTACPPFLLPSQHCALPSALLHILSSNLGSNKACASFRDEEAGMAAQLPEGAREPTLACISPERICEREAFAPLSTSRPPPKTLVDGGDWWPGCIVGSPACRWSWWCGCWAAGLHIGKPGPSVNRCRTLLVCSRARCAAIGSGGGAEWAGWC